MPQPQPAAKTGAFANSPITRGVENFFRMKNQATNRRLAQLREDRAQEQHENDKKGWANEYERNQLALENLKDTQEYNRWVFSQALEKAEIAKEDKLDTAGRRKLEESNLMLKALKGISREFRQSEIASLTEDGRVAYATALKAVGPGYINFGIEGIKDNRVFPGQGVMSNMDIDAFMESVGGKDLPTDDISVQLRRALVRRGVQEGEDALRATTEAREQQEAVFNFERNAAESKQNREVADFVGGMISQFGPEVGTEVVEGTGQEIAIAFLENAGGADNLVSKKSKQADVLFEQRQVSFESGLAQDVLSKEISTEQLKQLKERLSPVDELQGRALVVQLNTVNQRIDLAGGEQFYNELKRQEDAGTFDEDNRGVFDRLGREIIARQGIIKSLNALDKTAGDQTSISEEIIKDTKVSISKVKNIKPEGQEVVIRDLEASPERLSNEALEVKRQDLKDKGTFVSKKRMDNLRRVASYRNQVNSVYNQAHEAILEKFTGSDSALEFQIKRLEAGRDFSIRGVTRQGKKGELITASNFSSGRGAFSHPVVSDKGIVTFILLGGKHRADLPTAASLGYTKE